MFIFHPISTFNLFLFDNNATKTTNKINNFIQDDSKAEDIKLKVQLTHFALKKLDMIVDEFWPEISDSIQIIEVSS